ncbi:MAG: sensor histidine kinase [Tepidisphaerales bacterium]
MRRKPPPAARAWLVRLGGWKAAAAGVGILLLGSALTILLCLADLRNDRLLMQRMTADVMADFSSTHSSQHRWQLSLGLMVTLAASFGAWKHFADRDRQLQVATKYLTGLETLHRTIARVGSQMGQGRAILTEMAEAARRLLGMDSSVVLLLDSERRVFHAHAASGGFPKDAPSSFPVDQVPACFRAAQSGQVVFMADAEAAPSGINVALVRSLGANSVAVIPLRLEGKPVGVMVLADARPRRFPASDRRLAELLGAQTEAILANSRLYDEARAAAGVYQHLLLQQELLYEVAAAVYHAASLDESARAIVERAPAMLHVDGCSVQICEDDGMTLRIAASFDNAAESIAGLRFPVAGTCAEPVLKSGKMLVVEDAQDTARFPLDLGPARRAGSLVFLPFKRTGGSPFGLLVLTRKRPGPFADEQVRLLQVFADRAEAAMENALLHEQTRRDAQTKVVLLRELHHRVNNNLAGIVALLSMNQPEMSDAAKRWIHRSIERIEAMARAHDLFGQGAERVKLGDLIARVPESIAVFQTAQARIVTRLDGEEITLATPRAVSLAMVLHELCSNALLHGVKDGGQVTIQGVCMDRRVAVQVCDDGVGFDPGQDGHGPSATRRSGFGLQLVRELVGRELRGNLHIESAPGRGTTVSIAFPVDRDEENHP